jgi:hypothetical protein
MSSPSISFGDSAAGAERHPLGVARRRARSTDLHALLQKIGPWFPLLALAVTAGCLVATDWPTGLPSWALLTTAGVSYLLASAGVVGWLRRGASW